MIYMDKPILEAGSGSTTVTLTLNEPCTEFAINNQGSSSLTFEINDIEVTVPTKDKWDSNFAPFTSVVITASGTFYWAAG